MKKPQEKISESPKCSLFGSAHHRVNLKLLVGRETLIGPQVSDKQKGTEERDVCCARSGAPRRRLPAVSSGEHFGPQRLTFTSDAQASPQQALDTPFTPRAFVSVCGSRTAADTLNEQGKEMPRLPQAD